MRFARSATRRACRRPQGVLRGVVWAIRHPREGVDPDDRDFREVMAMARPYLGEVVGVFGDSTPLEGRESRTVY